MPYLERRRLRRLFLGGALAAAVAVLLLTLAPCDDPDLGDTLWIADTLLLLLTGALTGAAVLTRARTPRDWKGWVRTLLVILAAFLAAVGVIIFITALWFVLATIRCEAF
jgi:uncharacterized protein involved in response to NO